MEDFKRRIISMLLVLVLCMTMVPTTVLAAEGDEWLKDPTADVGIAETEEQQDDLAEPEATAPETELPILAEEETLPVEETTIAVEMPALMASGIVASGESDSGLTWTLDNNGKLTVYGSGELYFFDRCWDGLQSEIRTVVINSGVTSIGADVFSNCSNLTSITIPDSVTSIGWYSFGGCSSLASVTIPNSVTSIDWYSFSGCSSLTSVTIPAGVTYIGENIFQNCGNLTNITVESNHASYSSENGILYNKSKTELICCPEGKNGTFSVPYGVATIREYAFRGCSNLTGITIPSSVTSIGRDAFAECSNMNSITVNSGNTAYTSQDGVLYNKNKTELICCPKGKNGSFSIPGGVTKIGDDAFANCNWLTNITIPNSVTEIAYGSFAYCTGLSSVTIPASVTSIGSDAFWRSSNMNTVTFEGDAPSFGRTWSSVFYDVTATAYYPAGNVTWTDSVKQNYGGNITWVAKGGTASIVASGECGAQGDNLTWTLDSNGQLAISGTGAMEDWRWGDAPWYNQRDDIKTVVIENGATSIGDDAFYYCDSLTSVTIGNSVTSIGGYAFYHCTNLTSITIPESVTSIGSCVFRGCSILTDITVANGNTIYSSQNGILYNWDKTELICCPAGRPDAFTIPSSVTSIGDYAFYDCTNLTNITIPDSVTSIGGYAFCDCNSLTSVTIPDSVTSIGDDAFADCRSLTSVTIGNSVTSIGGYAFYHCTNLTSVTIPDSVTSIGERVFEGCSILTDITVANGNTIYSSQNGILYNSDKTELVCCPAGKTGTVKIPGSVSVIGHNAFADCGSLTDIMIPNSVTEIAYGSFAKCSALSSVTIPNSVTGIGDWAFGICTNLNTVIFEGNAPTFGSSVFGSVTTTAYYPAGNVTWTDAVKRSYGGNITWVPYSSDMPAIIASGECGAQGDNLTWTLDSNGQLTISGTGAMQDWSWSLRDAPWYSQRYYIKTVVIENGAMSIGSYAFYNCNSLTSVTIPDSVTSIGSGAFYNCNSLTSVTIPDSVTSIGSGAFLDCSSLTSVTIPDSVTSIGSSAFYFCSRLTSLTIPDSVTSIGNEAFYLCRGLTSLTIPDSVTSIGSFAFGSCDSLTSVTIGSGVTSIEYDAFHGCDSLTSVTFEGDAPYFGREVFYNVTATAYYPANNATWTDEVKQNYSGNITWVTKGAGDVVDPDALTVTVANVRARAGEKVTVPISISNNPGIMVMQLGISYDKSKLTLIGHEDSGLTGWSVANNMVWLGNSNSSYNGEILKLKFRVNESVEDGDIPVTLTYSAGNIANHDEEVFRPVIEAGKVTVYTVLPGDISGDGVVNALDLLRMKKALSGEDVEVVGNMDVTGDGMINALDLLRLQKYLSGEAVTIS